MNYEIEISIDATDKDQLSEKLEAIQTLVSTLKHDELLFLSNTIETKPTLLVDLRPLLEKDMNFTQVCSSAWTLYTKHFSKKG